MTKKTHSSNKTAITRRTALAALGGGLAYTILPSCTKPHNDIRVAVPAGPEGSALRRLAAEYKNARIAVAEYPYDNLRQKLTTSLNQSQGEFDLVLLDDPWFPLLSRDLQEIRVLPDDLANDIVQKSLDLCRDPYRTGTLKALPFVGSTQLLFVRKDLLPQRATLPALPTWSDIGTISEEISNVGRSAKEPFYGYAIRGRAGAPIVTDFLPIYWSLGGQLTQQLNGKTLSVVDTEKLEKSMDIYSKLAKASPKGALSFDWNEMTKAFEDGSAAIQLNWPIAIERLTKVLGQPNQGGTWDMLLPPGIGGPGTSMIGNWLLGVAGNSPRSADATAFAFWLMQQQEVVAGPLTPPTRISVFAALSDVPQTAYMGKIAAALKVSTVRDRTPRWGQIEEIVSSGIYKMLRGGSTSHDSAEAISSELNQAFNG